MAHKAFCLRIDLDYVPWDTPDADEFGHAEPAVFLRLLELGKLSGHKYHFFTSSRVLRAFSASADAVLNQGHHLDWYCKHPGDAGRFEEAMILFQEIGHQPRGLSIKESWPSELPWPSPELSFLSATRRVEIENVHHFPVQTELLHETVRSGGTMKAWRESAITILTNSQTDLSIQTLVVRPQVLGRVDPKLTQLRQMLEEIQALGYKISTLRDMLV